MPPIFFSVNFFQGTKKKKNQPIINVTALFECQKMYAVAQKKTQKKTPCLRLL
jgi:hypothetical protein